MRHSLHETLTSQFLVDIRIRPYTKNTCLEKWLNSTEQNCFHEHFFSFRTFHDNPHILLQDAQVSFPLMYCMKTKNGYFFRSCGNTQTHTPNDCYNPSAYARVNNDNNNNSVLYFHFLVACGICYLLLALLPVSMIVIGKPQNNNCNNL